MTHEARCGCILGNRAADPPIRACDEAARLLDTLPSENALSSNLWAVNTYIQHIADAKRSVIDPSNPDRKHARRL
jgi:hypothetical protein